MEPQAQPTAGVAQFVDSDPIIDEIVEVDVAIKRIKASRNRTIFLSCSQFARKKNQDGTPEGHAAGWTVHANVRVSAPAAVRYLNSAYGEHMRKKAFIRIGTCKTCMFLGGAC